MRLYALGVALALVSGCVLGKSVDLGGEDVDGDGYTTEEVGGSSDCNDSDETVHPNAEEVCDEVDNDCDGLTDEAGSAGETTWYVDADGDGYGDAAVSMTACDSPTQYVSDSTDCDDAAGEISPVAIEVCDEVDNDCDGLTDEAGSAGETTWYVDADGDGYGDPTNSTSACEQPTGSVVDNTDCEDAQLSVHPNAEEVCDEVDNNCDEMVDEDSAVDAQFWYGDADGDGCLSDQIIYSCTAPDGFVAFPDVYCYDCDDVSPEVNAHVSEICDGLDNNCSGVTDEDTAVDAQFWYGDADGDGYGDLANISSACEQPAGSVTDHTDCNDADGEINPAATESCDEVDNDCDGLTDEAGSAGETTWYADLDGDSFGDTSNSLTACEGQMGYVAIGDDCDDTAGSVNPDATELCDGLDNNCDGTADEDSAADALTWYVDYDADGFGQSRLPVTACEQPAGTVADATDCDDTAGGVNPAATELCDGSDNNCDGTADENSAADAQQWYLDLDVDGYGDELVVVSSCTCPAGYTSASGDCDDNNLNAHPGNMESCDEEDNNCDGQVDEGAPGTIPWYADADEDGFGDDAISEMACEGSVGYVTDNTDCDDTDPEIYYGATEICDGLDNNCSGVTDEDTAVDASTWYLDDDGDGYGATGLSLQQACSAPVGYPVDHNGDCNDADGDINPDAVELCDGFDNDCSGAADDDAVDASTWYADADEDGYGDANDPYTACIIAPGYITDATDCDDTDPDWFWACTECERQLVSDIGFDQSQVWPGQPEDVPALFVMDSSTLATWAGVRWLDADSQDWVTCGEVSSVGPSTVASAFVQLEEEYLTFGWYASAGVLYVPSSDFTQALIAGVSYTNEGDFGGNADFLAP